MKKWNDPELRSLNVNNTNTDEQETCEENNTKCICCYYHPKYIFKKCTGKGGCSAPGYKCQFTGEKPKITPQCSCTTEITTAS